MNYIFFCSRAKVQAGTRGYGLNHLDMHEAAKLWNPSLIGVNFPAIKCCVFCLFVCLIVLSLRRPAPIVRRLSEFVQAITPDPRCRFEQYFK
jgi:hypothetical protein